MQLLFVLSALPVPTAFSESKGQGSITTAKGCLLLGIGDVTEKCEQQTFRGLHRFPLAIVSFLMFIDAHAEQPLDLVQMSHLCQLDRRKCVSGFEDDPGFHSRGAYCRRGG